jgi:hypothetical protein
MASPSFAYRECGSRPVCAKSRMTRDPYWPLMRVDAMVNFDPNTLAVSPAKLCKSQEVAFGFFLRRGMSITPAATPPVRPVRHGPAQLNGWAVSTAELEAHCAVDVGLRHSIPFIRLIHATALPESGLRAERIRTAPEAASRSRDV